MYTNISSLCPPLPPPPQQKKREKKEEKNYDKQNFEIVSTKSVSDQDQHMYD